MSFLIIAFVTFEWKCTPRFLIAGNNHDKERMGIIFKFGSFLVVGVFGGEISILLNVEGRC